MKKETLEKITWAVIFILIIVFMYIKAECKWVAIIPGLFLVSMLFSRKPKKPDQ